MRDDIDGADLDLPEVGLDLECDECNELAAQWFEIMNNNWCARARRCWRERRDEHRDHYHPRTRNV